MLRYTIRNVLHYRTKYAIAFVLVFAFAACLALSLFAFNGFWKQAAAYARTWGDITFWVDSSRLDSAWKPAAGGEPPSRRLEREATAFFKSELKAERVVATAYVGGDAYAPRASWKVSVTSLEKARELAQVDLAEGEFPGEGEILAPTSMRGALKVGDGITFVFKNSDLILDSLRFRVSGFFLPTSDTENSIFASQAQFDRLDEKRVCDIYYVFLPGRTGRADFLSSSECRVDYQAFVGFLAKLTGVYGQIPSRYYPASQRYDQSKTLIQFFELIISIFLVALVVVAVATILNVLFTTIVDRIRIVGTFMAFGMTRARAILLLSSEMLVFSFVACTLGLLAALVLVDPVSRLKFTADNWTIAVILGGKRSLTVVPALWAVGATYLVGMAIPFVAAAAAVAKMIRGEVVGLLHFAK
jgi:hypothetical protein